MRQFGHNIPTALVSSIIASIVRDCCVALSLRARRKSFSRRAAISLAGA
jgi:hypothetical protein